MNIKEVTKLTGLSSKTLRHWESVDLLQPTRDKNGYRNYNRMEITRIFYIMSLRQLDLSLTMIKKILAAQMDEKTALTNHLSLLTKKKNQLSTLINILSNKLEKGDYHMSNDDFNTLKQKQIDENETKYGAEIRAKYGIETVEKANQKFLSSSEEGQKWASEVHEKIIQMLEEAYITNDILLAAEAVRLHKIWLEFYWSNPVTAEAHIGLGQMYCDDERFRANYNKIFTDLSEFFRDNIIKFYENK